MKSILMKANYDPRYVAPHTKTWPQPTVLRHPTTLHHSTSIPLHHATSLHHKLNGYASLHSRLNTMRDIYGVPTDQSLRGSLQASARLQTKHRDRQVNVKLFALHPPLNCTVVTRGQTDLAFFFIYIFLILFLFSFNRMTSSSNLMVTPILAYF